MYASDILNSKISCFERKKKSCSILENAKHVLQFEQITNFYLSKLNFLSSGYFIINLVIGISPSIWHVPYAKANYQLV